VSYDVENIDLARQREPLRRKFRRWHQLAELAVGQAIRVPESELSRCALDPTGTLRTIAWFYGKQLGRRFRTQRQVNGSVLIYRVE